LNEDITIACFQREPNNFVIISIKFNLFYIAFYLKVIGMTHWKNANRDDFLMSETLFLVAYFWMIQKSQVAYFWIDS